MKSVMTHTSQESRRKIHPHKFSLWIAMASIAMMFAGLTSAYVVKQAGGHWRTYELPVVFYVSTVVILLSSVLMILGVKAFKSREIPKYRRLITFTLILGIAFCVLQAVGFYQLYQIPQQVVYDGVASENYAPVTVSGNPGESFLFVIAGLHLLHILGGIVALAIVFFKAYRTKVKVYNTTGIEIVAAYWHFVDVLWIYLFLFFLANQ
jgi:cytochrome c oxidase subunit 3